MKKKNAQLVNFRFDESKSFEENSEAFLEAIEASDPEMTTIMSSNWNALVVMVLEGERDTKARCDFNAKIALALDALVTKMAGSQEGK